MDAPLVVPVSGFRSLGMISAKDRLTTAELSTTQVPLFNLLAAMDGPSSGMAWLAMRRGPGNASPAGD